MQRCERTFKGEGLPLALIYAILGFFHSIFIKFSLKQTFLSLSLVSLTLSSVASECDDDDDDDDDDDECFLRTMIKNNVLNVLLSEG